MLCIVGAVADDTERVGRTRPPGPRALQREASRQRLLDAAFASLVDNGYGGTTTAAIAARAGLSNGAMFNYFDSKDDLLVAAVLELLPATNATLDATLVAAVHAAEDPVRAAVELVWLGMFAPVAVASAELYLAARTNPHLRDALRAVEPDSREALEAVTAQMFPGLADWDGLSALVTIVRSYVFGAASAETALGPHQRFERSRDMLADALAPIIQRASSGATQV
jgi:AcrR family transcriptional regulator